VRLLWWASKNSEDKISKPKKIGKTTKSHSFLFFSLPMYPMDGLVPPLVLTSLPHFITCTELSFFYPVSFAYPRSCVNEGGQWLLSGLSFFSLLPNLLPFATNIAIACWALLVASLLVVRRAELAFNVNRFGSCYVHMLQYICMHPTPNI